MIKMSEEDEYNHGFEDALDLVFHYMQKYEDKLPKEFVISIREIIQETKDRKIEALKQDLSLVGDDISIKEKKTKK